LHGARYREKDLLMTGKHIHSAYFNIKQSLWNAITSGEYKAGERLPAISELSERFGVSARTVHQAINELGWEGIVKAVQGKGTFVALPKLEYDILQDFSEQADLLGGHARTEIFDTKWVVPEPLDVKRLGLKKGEVVWEVEKLHYLDEVPIMVESTQFPRRLAKKVMDNMNKLRSTYEFLQQNLGLKRIDVTVSSIKITSERKFADQLHIPYKPYRTTFYQFERLIAANDKPLLVSFHVLRSDKFQLGFHAQKDTSRTRIGKLSHGPPDEPHLSRVDIK